MVTLSKRVELAAYLAAFLAEKLAPAADTAKPDAVRREYLRACEPIVRTLLDLVTFPESVP